MTFCTLIYIYIYIYILMCVVLGYGMQYLAVPCVFNNSLLVGLSVEAQCVATEDTYYRVRHGVRVCPIHNRSTGFTTDGDFTPHESNTVKHLLHGPCTS